MSLVISLLVLLLVVYIIGMLALPNPARFVVNIIVAIIVLVYLARLLGVNVGV